jgi:hypothetical protein
MSKKVTINDMFSNPKGWMNPPKPKKWERVERENLGGPVDYSKIGSR